MKVNGHLAHMSKGYLFADIARRVKAYEAEHPGQTILRLGIGDVTQPLVSHVAAAFSDAAAKMGTPEGFHGYAPDGGYAFLLNAVAERDYAPLGVSIAPDEIFISDGAKSDVSNLQEIFSADTRIAVTDPVYPVYVDANAMAGRLGECVRGVWERLVTLPCTAENGFVPALPQTPVDVLYLCYPNNPTGTVLTRPQLKKIVDWANAHDVLIVYDAAYKAYITEADIPHSIFEIEGARTCAVECCSFSKTAGFTGVRCAYMVIPREVMGRDGEALIPLNALWRRRMETKFNGVSYPVQRAAEAVLSDVGQREIAAVIALYMNNARIIREGLEKAGFTVYGGVNAPYIWMKTPDNMSSWDFFDALLSRAQVVGTPGAGFGTSGEGYFRLTAFNTPENTEKAVERIVRAF